MAIPLKDKIYVLLQGIVFLSWILPVEIFTFSLPEVLRIAAVILTLAGAFLIVFAFIQLNTKISPFPSPVKGAKLVSSGVYAFVRHPIYAGILYVAFGLSLWMGSGYKLLLTLVLLLVFWFKTNYEEERLQKTFPEYEAYRAKKGRFFPKFNR
ncbi:methyltransferase family protein [Salinimicrobium soli]|uniref:methyltransferase family protein n=1 Tax=Salinimicrobium soli TaxID=1254399 RepID=UPI003AB0179B